jgi:DNA-binding CsgD family transcriptional regulator
VIHSAELSQTVIAAINMALARDIDVDLFHKTHVIARPSGAAPYSLQVSALSGQPCFGTTGSVPSAIVFIVNPELGVRLDARQLQDLYRLTPAEARVAVQLSEGEDLTQLAAMLGVSINTVKSQIRNIYEKMGIDSRAAFLRAAMSHSTVQIGFVAQRPVGRR